MDNTEEINNKLKELEKLREEARERNDEDAFFYAQKNIEKLQNEITSKNNNNSTNLSTLKDMLKEDGFIVLCHGTNLSMEEIEQKIMKDGLYATGYNEGSSLFKTTNPVDINISTEELKNKLDNWPHSSENIVFLKLPLEYFNIYADNSDLDCQKTRAFMNKTELEDGRYKYLLDPKFVVGAYNIKGENVVINPKYEQTLSEETKTELSRKLKELQQDIGVLDIEEEQEIKNPEVIEEVENINDYKYCYKKTLEAIKNRQALKNPTEKERKDANGKIFYYEGYLVNNIKDDNTAHDIINSLLNDLNTSDSDLYFQNIILKDIQERLNNIKKVEQSTTEPVEEEDFSTKISKLREEASNAYKEYKNMLTDGLIDDEELANLIRIMNKLKNDAHLLKSITPNNLEKELLNSITNEINEWNNSMIIMQNGMEKLDSISSRSI